jgi:redox-regulated HSP33 family molecular chaperone
VKTEQLRTFLMAGDTIRGALLNGSRMINQMRWNHELGILETLVLGHAYLGACLMSAGLKGKDRLMHCRWTAPARSKAWWLKPTLPARYADF